MRYVNWKKTYEIGVYNIDKQHKRIFEIVNRFYNELFSEQYNNENNKVFEILKELKQYCKYHFDYERNIYSKEIIAEYFSNEYKLLDEIELIVSPTNKYLNIIKLYVFAEHLRQWIVKHVLLLNDNKFKEVLKKEIVTV